MHHISILSLFTLSFITFFATINPINCLIVFLKLTRGYTKSESRLIANRAITVASIILIIVTLIGSKGFSLLGINLYSVKIAGGVILMIVSVGMVFGVNKEFQSGSLKVKDSIVIVPLAMPIISGPAAIVSSLVLFTEYKEYYYKIVIFASLLLNIIILFIVFNLSYSLEKVIKKSVLNILFILTGIVTTSLATQFIISGIKDSRVFKKIDYNIKTSNHSSKKVDEFN